MAHTANLETLRCSFCAKNQSDVVTLVAGPGVFICNECIDLCNQVVAEELRRKKTRQSDGTQSGTPPSPPLSKAWEPLTDEELLAEMVQAHGAHQNVDRAVAHHVAALRARGVTWARIGGALGMTRQSAWERFSGGE